MLLMLLLVVHLVLQPLRRQGYLVALFHLPSVQMHWTHDPPSALQEQKTQKVRKKAIPLAK